jgi:catechol-2,3-dioxygenase
VVLLVERMEDVRAFYLDVLGLKMSDFMTAPFNAAFMHTGPRHHSLALLEAGAVALHHFMVELQDMDDVGSTYDLVQEEKIDVAATLGRHSNDRMLSFYMRSPAGFQVEYGWGGLSIDDDTWEVKELERGPSIWGHSGIG